MTIQAGGVGATQLASNAVETAKINNEAVTESKLNIGNSPSTNNVLSWNGTSMSWASPPLGDADVVSYTWPTLSGSSTRVAWFGQSVIRIGNVVFMQGRGQVTHPNSWSQLSVISSTNSAPTQPNGTYYGVVSGAAGSNNRIVGGEIYVQAPSATTSQLSCVVYRNPASSNIAFFNCSLMYVEA